jgi:hypothetical protein
MLELGYAIIKNFNAIFICGAWSTDVMFPELMMSILKQQLMYFSISDAEWILNSNLPPSR